MNNFKEILFTHCHGIDLLDGEKPLSGREYRVFSADFALFTRPNITFLNTAVQKKFPFGEGSGEHQFAYFACSPFLMRGTSFEDGIWQYADTRGGKFINQGYFGNFTIIRPTEMLNDPNIWDAYEKGLDYYNTEGVEKHVTNKKFTPLPGYFYEIGNFIADGRREILKNAVAFILKEYAKPKHERRFLVIKDNVEKWIAAIHYALPSQMASAVSFVTKAEITSLEKIGLNNNKYVVDKTGKFDYDPFEPGNENKKTNKKNERIMFMLVGIKTPVFLADSEEYEVMSKISNVDSHHEYYNLITKLRNH